MYTALPAPRSSALDADGEADAYTTRSTGIASYTIHDTQLCAIANRIATSLSQHNESLKQRAAAAARAADALGIGPGPERERAELHAAIDRAQWQTSTKRSELAQGAPLLTSRAGARDAPCSTGEPPRPGETATSTHASARCVGARV